MNEFFGNTSIDFKQKQYEKIKAQLIATGTDPKVAEYKAKEKIFTPDKLEKIYIKTEVENNNVTFYFKNKEDLELVCKHFKLSGYNGFNTDKVELLVSLLKSYEKGTLTGSSKVINAFEGVHLESRDDVVDEPETEPVIEEFVEVVPAPKVVLPPNGKWF